MDALRLAFDTLIVGALALPWVAIIVRIFFPGFTSSKPEETIRLLSVVPEHTRDAVASVLLIAMGYFAGSAVTRMADDFFDDDEIPYLPVEHTIRNHVYCEEENANVMKKLGWPWGELDPNIGDPLNCPAPSKGDTEVDSTYEVFHLQEQKLLQSGTDKIERLQQLHEQIVVLRGTALNAILFAALCMFGVVAEYRTRQTSGRAIRKYLTYVPSLALAALGLKWMWEHWKTVGPNYSLYSHPPTMEIVVILLGIAGLFVIVPENDQKLYRNGFFLSMVFAVLAYLGWWGTEVIYNQYVIHAIYSVTANTTGTATSVMSIC